MPQDHIGKVKLADYRNKLKHFQLKLGKAKESYQDTKQKEDLLSADASTEIEVNKIEVINLAEKQRNKLNYVKNKVLQTENSGKEILLELSSQTGKMETVKCNLNEVETEVGFSKRLVKKMAYSLRKNKIILWFVGILLLLILIGVVVYKVME